MTARAALFLEREGVLIADAGPCRDPDQVRLLPGAAAVVRRLGEAGVAVVVVTDQPAIGRGELDEQAYAATSERLERLLADEGARLAGSFHCPAAEAHRCRKPRPGLLLQAARDLGLDLFASWMVGRHADDARAAGQAGCQGVVLVGGATPPAEDLGLVVAAARDLADAPRVMLPKGGGCWHEHRP